MKPIYANFGFIQAMYVPGKSLTYWMITIVVSPLRLFNCIFIQFILSLLTTRMHVKNAPLCHRLPCQTSREDKKMRCKVKIR